MGCEYESEMFFNFIFHVDFGVKVTLTFLVLLFNESGDLF